MKMNNLADTGRLEIRRDYFKRRLNKEQHNKKM